MIEILITIVKVIFLLGFLVFIHEGGHFIVAKLSKVKVNEFAIGFGPTIWKSEKGETKYALRLIPLGGFVSMEGEEERSEAEGSFSKTSIPKRIAIVAAGGLVNIVFGLIVYFILVAVTGQFVSQKINLVQKDFGAIEAGLVAGDEIRSINNKKIRRQEDISNILENSNGEEVSVVIKRDNQEIEYKVKPTNLPSKDTGIYLGMQGENVTTKIVGIYPNSPAEKAGIQVNDIIKSINGKDVENDPYKIVQYISESTQDVEFEILRRDETIKVSVMPNTVNNYYLGIQFEIAEKNMVNNLYYAFWDTIDFSVSIIDNLKMLFTGKVSANQLMGPVGISGVVAQTNGIKDFINILALISLSLGITNLLPFPPLDGGKIVILLIEAIRRKPLNENIEIKMQLLGFAILITLSIFITYNDILRLG